MYGALDSAASSAGSKEAAGVAGCLEHLLQVQPVPDTEEVSGEERALARSLLVAERLVEFEGGDVVAGNV